MGGLLAGAPFSGTPRREREEGRQRGRLVWSDGFLTMLGPYLTMALPCFFWDRLVSGPWQWGIFPRLAYDTFKEKEDNWKVTFESGLESGLRL